MAEFYGLYSRYNELEPVNGHDDTGTDTNWRSPKRLNQFAGGPISMSLRPTTACTAQRPTKDGAQRG